MKNYIFFFSIFLLLYANAEAQKKNVYFIKYDGQYVTQRDSADYIRIVEESQKDSKLFMTREFYANGKRKSVGMSATIDPPKYEGTYLSFYPNGNKKEIAIYNDGRLVDSAYHYYPNGQLYTFFVYDDQPLPKHRSIARLKMANDSTGKSLTVNGNGTFIVFDSDLKEIVEKGNVKNGQKDGLWTGKDEITTFTQTYADGKLIAGESTDKAGATLNYTKEYIEPQFKGGIKELYKYLAINIRYPESSRVNHIQGVVMLKFTVEADGSINTIRVVNYVDPDLAAEAIRVLKKAPLWTPGKRRGRAVRVTYSIPVSFSLN